MILSFLYIQTFKFFVVIFWRLTEHIITYILIMLVYLKMSILNFGKKRRVMCRLGYNPHSARTSIPHVTCGTCEFLEMCTRAAESHAYTLCETAAGSCATLLLARPPHRRSSKSRHFRWRCLQESGMVSVVKKKGKRIAGPRSDLQRTDDRVLLRPELSRQADTTLACVRACWSSTFAHVKEYSNLQDPSGGDGDD
jgi:hypothetical protein